MTEHSLFFVKIVREKKTAFATMASYVRMHFSPPYFSLVPGSPGAEAARAEELDLLEAVGPGLATRHPRHGHTASRQALQAQLTLQQYTVLTHIMIG